MTHHRKHTFRPDCEGLEGRQLLSWAIVSVNSDKVLDVRGRSKADGALVQQWQWNGGRNQRWNIIPLGNGADAIESVNSGKVLDVRGRSKADGALVQQWQWNGGRNQQGVLVRG